MTRARASRVVAASGGCPELHAVRRLLPAGATAATFMLMFARIGTMVMLLPGLGEMSVPARVRLTVALVLTRRCCCRCIARPTRSICAARARCCRCSGRRLMVGRGARHDGAAHHFGAAGRRRGDRAADGPRLRHRGRSDAGPAGRASSANFLTHARRHADLRDRPASSRDRGAATTATALFAPGEISVWSATSRSSTTKTVAGAFRIGIQLSAPFLVFGLLFNLGLGVLSRLMPQMQVFFVGLPLSILLGFLILLVVVGAMMTTLPRASWAAVLRELAPYSYEVRARWPSRAKRTRNQKTQPRNGWTKRSKRGDVAKSQEVSHLVRAGGRDT